MYLHGGRGRDWGRPSPYGIDITLLAHQRLKRASDDWEPNMMFKKRDFQEINPPKTKEEFYARYDPSVGAGTALGLGFFLFLVLFKTIVRFLWRQVNRNAYFRRLARKPPLVYEDDDPPTSVDKLQLSDKSKGSKGPSGEALLLREFQPSPSLLAYAYAPSPLTPNPYSTSLSPPRSPIVLQPPPPPKNLHKQVSIELPLVHQSCRTPNGHPRQQPLQPQLSAPPQTTPLLAPPSPL